MSDPKRVEIKLTIDAQHVASAREQLGLTDRSATRIDIWLCERIGRGEDRPLELASRGVIVRLRHRFGEDSDTTVKYRRPGRLALPAGWDDPDVHRDLKVEGTGRARSRSRLR
ncbi:MAG TPA: hypothetical protein VJM33_17385 [Microthrixaceae bacterium]|nr:hypothetical protein [Microthrixaceae bacterium]